MVVLNIIANCFNFAGFPESFLAVNTKSGSRVRGSPSSDSCALFRVGDYRQSLRRAKLHTYHGQSVLASLVSKDPAWCGVFWTDSSPLEFISEPALARGGVTKGEEERLGVMRAAGATSYAPGPNKGTYSARLYCQIWRTFFPCHCPVPRNNGIHLEASACTVTVTTTSCQYHSSDTKLAK